MKLGDWLLSKGRITEEQLARALQDQAFFGWRLGNSLIKLGFLDEDTLGEYLADVSRSRYAPPKRLESISQEVIAAVPARLAARYRIVPIAIEGRKLHLAMRDPKDLIALDEIAFLTGLAIEPYVATEFRIVQAIERYYRITIGTKTIPVSGGQEDTRLASDARPADRAAPPPPPSGPEMGLDGLPLDAATDDLDEPFMSAGAGVAPRQAADDEPVPASLDEWRMAQQEVPEQFRATALVTTSSAGAPAALGGAGPRPAGPTSEAAPAPPPRSVMSPPGPARAGTAPAPVASDPGALETIAARLRSAETRDEVFSAILDFTAARFQRAALFVVQQDRVLGWSGRGESLKTLRIRNVTVMLDRPSLFVFFRSGGDYYYGPVPDLPANARFYLDMGCPAPARVLLLPLTIKERPAVILYADNGAGTGKAPDVQLFRRLLQKAALALEVLILRNKIMMI